MPNQTVPKGDRSVSLATHARGSRHNAFGKHSRNSSDFSELFVASKVHFFRRAPSEEEVMETMLQGLVIIGGLTFSLAASLLIEELIFGRIVRLAFAPRPKISALGSKSAGMPN